MFLGNILLTTDFFVFLTIQPFNQVVEHDWFCYQKFERVEIIF